MSTSSHTLFQICLIPGAASAHGAKLERIPRALRENSQRMQAELARHIEEARHDFYSLHFWSCFAPTNTPSTHLAFCCCCRLMLHALCRFVDLLDLTPARPLRTRPWLLRPTLQRMATVAASVKGGAAGSSGGASGSGRNNPAVKNLVRRLRNTSLAQFLEEASQQWRHFQEEQAGRFRALIQARMPSPFPPSLFPLTACPVFCPCLMSRARWLPL